MTDRLLIDGLRRYNPWWHGDLVSPGLPRESLVRIRRWLGGERILVLRGFRRVGKTMLLQQAAVERIRLGVPARDVLYVDFEAPPFADLLAQKDPIEGLFQAYVEVMAPGPLPLLLLDEVQDVPGWQRWVREAVATNRARVAVTGSSLRLLEDDLDRVLTGRTVEEVVWPLSFREYLQFRRAGDRSAPDDTAPLERLQAELVRFLDTGGLPWAVLQPEDADRGTLLRQLFNQILYDVVRRHRIENVEGLDRVARHYLAHTGKEITYTRIKNQYGIGIDQVKKYSALLEKAFLVQFLPRYSAKVSEHSKIPHKVFSVDTGVRNAVAFRTSPDRGFLAETVVLRGLQRDPDVKCFFHKGRFECDFIPWCGMAAREAIQVWFGDEPIMPDREMAGLLEAMEALHLDRGTILTRSQTWERMERGRRIGAMPLARWLLQPESGAAPGGGGG